MEKMETKPKILVVDSGRGFVVTARKALETTFEVVVASSLKEGLDKAKRQSPDLPLHALVASPASSFYSVTIPARAFAFMWPIG